MLHIFNKVKQARSKVLRAKFLVALDDWEKTVDKCELLSSLDIESSDDNDVTTMKTVYQFAKIKKKYYDSLSDDERLCESEYYAGAIAELARRT